MELLDGTAVVARRHGMKVTTAVMAAGNQRPMLWPGAVVAAAATTGQLPDLFRRLFLHYKLYPESGGLQG